MQGPPRWLTAKGHPWAIPSRLKSLLELLVGVVDAELLKAVELKHLKPVGEAARLTGLHL